MFQKVLFRTMTMMMLAVSIIGCRKPTTTKSTIKGGRVSSNDLALSDGNLMSHPGKPGVSFGTIKLAGNDEQICYLIVFKHADSKHQESNLHKSNCSLTGEKGTSNCTVGENGKKIQTDYEIGLDDKGQIVAEQLKVSGKIVDLTAGRLFLIDLSSVNPNFEQKNPKHLDSIKVLNTSDDVEIVANNMLKSLKEEIPKEFWNSKR